ncbi:ecotropic viral integration site 5 -like protein [Brachionus plicatilis]|uniref:Ecotropic viral integration site 5-like protein n=1 Tax=Brachionus plicatilis TaxID=10195 RepID=A0A3M7P9B5_BRAPC|nr:ecotropic viral integration site 5 -like protein [Brachionus plicatilis]
MCPIDTSSLSTSSTSSSSSNLCNMGQNLNSSNSDTKENFQNVSDTDLIPLANNELDLLIKLERANKEMENNSRSAQSILLSNNSIGSGTANNNSSPTSHSLSRRASFTSCEVQSLNNDDNISKMDEVSWELWNQIISEWTYWSKKKPIQLKEYIRKGIPVFLRPIAWQYLCGANETDHKEKFKEFMKKQSSCEKIIRRDIDRTYPDHEYFRNTAGQESLFNIMKAYSIHDPEVGYCQGSAFICGLLLIQNLPEEEAFAIFVQIMQKYNLREIYKPNMYHLGLCMFQLDNLVQESFPDLHHHFSSHAFHSSMYCSSWFLTLFTTSLPLQLVCRIFDIFLSEGIEIVFRVGLAILEYHKDNLLTLDMEGMLKYFQKELPARHENDHDGLLNKALAIKYNQKKMKKLEKDYSIFKKEEQEEQIETRRLRAENKLLKQRIDNLEKESAQLADRLIKGQVINAQQLESIDVLKNENQKLKDKIKEMEIEYANSNELRKKELNEKNVNNNEKEMLHEKVNMLLEENSKLRDTPDVQRLEEELVQVKMREAEAQLAIKELQKTIHVLNLEYQEFLNNRTAVVTTLNSSSGTENKSISSNETQALEEELLKVKMREAETQSEMKSVNLKLMQLDTEKQVAYNQIKRQDEEIRKLNAQITQMCEKELDSKSHLMEYRRQLDDKEALLKESMMTHKIQEIEDASVIAELKQRVASLEVQIQEFLTTGQLNDTGKSLDLYNGMSGSIDKLIDMNDDLKNLMSSQTSLLSDKISLIRTNSFKPDLINPVNKSLNGTIKNGNTGSLNSLNDPKKLSRSQSEECKKKKLSEPDLKANMNLIPDSTPNHHVIAEYLDSDEDNLDELDRSYQSSLNDKSNSSENASVDKSNSSKELKLMKTVDVDLAQRPSEIGDLETVYRSDFVKVNFGDEAEN